MEIMEIDTEINFETVCRLCIKPIPEMRRICAGQLVDMLKNIATISIEEDDGLPQHMCDACITDINRCYYFKAMVIKNDSELRMILHNRAINYLCDLGVAVEEPHKEEVFNAEPDVKKEIIDEDLQDQDCVVVKEEIPKDPLDLEPEIEMPKCQSKFLCKICTAELGSLVALRQHIKVHEAINPRSCQICHKLLRNAQAWRRHMMTHSIGKLSLTNHMKAHNSVDKRKFHCQECGYRCRQNWQLINHMSSHTGEQPYKCTLCPKGFSIPSHLRNHMMVHTGERPYTCSFCQKSFLRNSILQDHIVAVHRRLKPYPCPECDKSFATKGHLKIHYERLHVKERPYGCSECGKKFIDKNRFDSHMRGHTGEKKPLRFTCSYCEKRFATTAEVRIHERIHTDERPYQCDLCGKKLRTSSNLAAHKRGHTGEKRHICQHCGKAFKESSILKVHIRTHTGERPYSCELCKMRFTQKGTLKTHMKVHTKDVVTN